MDKNKVGSTIDGELDRILAAMKSIRNAMRKSIIGMGIALVVMMFGVFLPGLGGLLIWAGGIIICSAFINQFLGVQHKFDREVGKFDGIVFVTDWLKTEIEKEKSQKPDGQQ